MGELTGAVEAFRDLMQRTPGYVPTYLMLAQTLQRQGKEPEAADALRRGIAVAKAAGEEHALSELQALLAIVE
jgi:predicted Zn-dependent protease